MNRQIESLRNRMAEKGTSAALVTNMTNIGWLTGFTGSSAFVILTPTDGVFITDSRYSVQAREQVKGLPVEIYANPVTGADIVANHAKRLNIERLGFESDTMTYAAESSFAKKLNGIVLMPIDDLVSPLRMTKSSEEIEKIRKACQLADACFNHVTSLIRVGVAELDLAIEIEFYFRRHGAKSAFDVIAASGERSARPHGTASEKKLEKGDFLTLDFGAMLDGYNSDMTRTVLVGEASDRHRKIYGAVLESQLAALESMRPGVECKAVDGVSREVLAKHDLAQYFGHGLGHGLGRLVHDFGSLSPSSTQTLAEGQVWTVEPGVYIEGYGGVRIEDDVLVTSTGVEILTKSPKELLIFG